MSYAKSGTYGGGPGSALRCRQQTPRSLLAVLLSCWAGCRDTEAEGRLWILGGDGDAGRESCHADTADWSRPDSAQVDHDRSHHLRLACTLFVLLLFSVLRKRQQRDVCSRSSRNTRREKLSKTPTTGLPQQSPHRSWHILCERGGKTAVLSNPRIHKHSVCLTLCCLQHFRDGSLQCLILSHVI